MADGELVVSTSAISRDRQTQAGRRISEALDFLGIMHRLD
jgi:hypothetical protein